ncbi:Hok/Gef family protein [Mangrovibacter phragmitis]|uniref:Hok/Gef family protein n=1 Tax=Mangrovibacter phragmitis TaxID=1691903 RepID=UPI00351556DC
MTRTRLCEIRVKDGHRVVAAVLAYEYFSGCYVTRFLSFFRGGRMLMAIFLSVLMWRKIISLTKRSV